MDYSKYQKLWDSSKQEIKKSMAPDTYNDTIDQAKSVVKFLNGTIYILCPSLLIKTKMNKMFSIGLNEILQTLTEENLKFKFVTSDEVTSKEAPKETSNLSQTNLKPEYTFETFVAGSSNKLAYRTSLTCAQQGVMLANPLYIFGGVGLGKTHIMQAIGNYILDNDINKKVLYIETQTFINEYSKAARTNTYDEFDKKFENLDVLLIDDIQMLSNAPKCQNKFFDIFTSMHNKDKLIVCASDRPSDQLKDIVDRLKSRFQWGLQVDIEKPDFELREKILKRKLLETSEQVVPDDVIEYIAKNFTDNIRELEGALRRVLSYAVTFDQNVTLTLAKKALEALLKNKNDSGEGEDYEALKSIICDFYQIEMSDLISTKKSAKFTNPRHICMYILRTKYDLPYKRIGYLLGGKDHSSVLSACEKISLQIKTDNELKLAIDTILKKIG